MEGPISLIFIIVFVHHFGVRRRFQQRLAAIKGELNDHVTTGNHSGLFVSSSFDEFDRSEAYKDEIFPTVSFSLQRTTNVGIIHIAM